MQHFPVGRRIAAGADALAVVPDAAQVMQIMRPVVVVCSVHLDDLQQCLLGVLQSTEMTRNEGDRPFRILVELYPVP